LAYWREQLSAPALALVSGGLVRGRDVRGAAGHLQLELSSAVTASLLTRVAGAFHAGINEVLLTGLLLSVLQWCRRRGFGGGDAALALGHVVEINALTVEGAAGPRLVASWSWAAALLRRGDVEELARGWFAALSLLVEHVAAGGGGRSPSDVGLLSLTQDEI